MALAAATAQPVAELWSVKLRRMSRKYVEPGQLEEG